MGRRGEGGMEVGEEGDTCRYTVTTWMTSVLRWAAMRAILMFHNCEGQSHKTVSADHNLWSERRAVADSNRGPSAYQPTSLTARPNRLTLGPVSVRHLQCASRSRSHWVFLSLHRHGAPDQVQSTPQAEPTCLPSCRRESTQVGSAWNAVRVILHPLLKPDQPTQLTH